MRIRIWTVCGLMAGFSPGLMALEFDHGYGESSFKFLKLSLSPRSMALGGAGAALLDGIGDADLNPASAARDSGSLAMGQGYPSQASAAGSHVAWNIPWQNRRITLHTRYLGYDDIPGYDGLGRPTAGYGAHTLKLQAGIAGTVFGFAYGVSTAFAQNNIADVDYGTGLLNAGIQRALPWGLSAGLSVINADYWTSSAVDGSILFPPTSIQAGLAYARSFPGEFRASLALDARTRNDEQLCFPAGIEAAWKETLMLSFGFPFGVAEASV